MMFRWWKKPGVRTITFTPTREAAKSYPPVPIKTVIPGWYKKMPMHIFRDSINAFNMQNVHVPHTAKRCIPMRDYMTSGYLIRHNADTLISTRKAENGDQAVFYRGPISEDHNLVSFHDFYQFPLLIEGEKKGFFKFSGGHVIRTPPGYSTLFYQPETFFEDRYTLLPGIVDTDTYDNEVFFPGWVNKGVTDFEVNAGDPLMVAFPFKRDEWQSVVEKELGSTVGPKFKHLQFIHRVKIYLRHFHHKKRYD